MTLQQFCLRWNNHQPNFISVFTNLLNNEALVDVTLAAEGQHLQAHRVVLSACSSYFQTLFTVNPCQHPIVILKDVKFSDLKTMVDFMYYGEVNVSQEQLPAILKTAEMLKIKGLTEMPEKHIGTGAFHLSKSSSLSFDKTDMMTSVDSTGGADVRRSPSPTSPVTSRRKRLRKSSTGSGSGSTERTSEETFSEITIVPCDVKPEPLEAAVASLLKNTVRDASTDSDPQGGSQESIDEEATSLQGSQDSITGAVDMPVSIADTGPGHSSSQQSTIDLQALHGALQNLTWSSHTPCNIYQALKQTLREKSDHSCSKEGDLTNTWDSAHTKPPTNKHFKRKPQSSKNFSKALEAVRSGEIGFNKAARKFGVNNRTLWLEYKKRGYTVSRKRKSSVADLDAAAQVVLQQIESDDSLFETIHL